MDINDYELEVTFGSAWKKLVAASIVSGVLSAGVTFWTGRQVFKNTFNQTVVMPIKKEG